MGNAPMMTSQLAREVAGNAPTMIFQLVGEVVGNAAMMGFQLHSVGNILTREGRTCAHP